MRNCMFQYATDKEIICNTDLISQEQAVEMFESKKTDYIKRLENEENPEMVIWVNCSGDGDYHSTLYHWVASEFKVINGELYQKV